MENEKAPMSNEELGRRHKALAESVELLAGSTHDLRAISEALLKREQEQHAREQARWERDSHFLGLIAQVLQTWAAPPEPQK